jgi:hypothetical protein
VRILSTMFVCTLEAAPGVHVGASWDGGKTIWVHVASEGRTVRAAGWRIWNDEWDTPLIEPTRQSFEGFVAARVSEPGAVGELLAQAAEA